MRRCLGLLLALLLAAPAQARDPLQATAIDGQPGAQVPLQLQFRDATGRSVTLFALSQGRPILIEPVQHHCPNLCGYALDGLAGRLRETGLGGAVTVVALGIDPREGPAEAASSQARLASLPHTAALVGPATSIAAVTGALGYRYRWDPAIGQYAHLSAVAVLTPDGRLSTWLYGLQPPAGELRAAVRLAGEGGLGRLGARLLLLCYHYAPVDGRYDAAVGWALRLAAALAALGLAAFIGANLWRDRRRSAP